MRLEDDLGRVQLERSKLQKLHVCVCCWYYFVAFVNVHSIKLKQVPFKVAIDITVSPAAVGCRVEI